jgi:hypothetical protein
MKNATGFRKQLLNVILTLLVFLLITAGCQPKTHPEAVSYPTTGGATYMSSNSVTIENSALNPGTLTSALNANVSLTD